MTTKRAVGSEGLPDKLGQPLHPGDFILYAHGETEMSFGVILELWEEEGRMRMFPRYKIQGVEISWFNGDQRLKKPTILPYPKRILKANSFIPDDQKALLES